MLGRILIRFPLRRGVKSGKAKQEGGSFPLKVDIKTGIGALVEEREREREKYIFIPICSNSLSENKALRFHFLVSNAQARCSASLSRLRTLSHGNMYLDFIKYLTHSFHLTRA